VHPSVTPDEPARRLQHALGSRYQVAQCLGVGGFAHVFAAWEFLPKRWVAVKSLHAEHDSVAHATERFRREIQILAALRHPNVVPAYEVGQSEGLLYCVMPLINGGTLAEKLKASGPLPLPEAARIVEEAASGLQEAHNHNVVHRDVKPTNIMFDGEAHRVVLVDFGIAQITDASALTSSGMIIGTASYMSPEQVGGEDADHRSDQYALAVVCHEMLSGKTPFAAPTPEEELFRRLRAPPPPVRATRPDIPEAVDVILTRALDIEPGRRFESVCAFADALRMATDTPSITRPAQRRLLLIGHSAGQRVRARIPDHGELVIGRSRRADVALIADEHVSHRHCRLVWSDRRLVVEDLGSRNGTYVNSARTARSELAPGDTLRVGATTLVLQSD
jgi:serine/threonine protein kinase